MMDDLSQKLREFEERTPWQEEARYLFADGLTLQQMEDALGITKERIRQVIARSERCCMPPIKEVMGVYIPSNFEKSSLLHNKQLPYKLRECALSAVALWNLDKQSTIINIKLVRNNLMKFKKDLQAKIKKLEEMGI